jgi:hypothetical protein
MKYLLFFALLLGYSWAQAQDGFVVPKALVGKWIAVDTINPKVQKGYKPESTVTRNFKVSRTWAICEFFSDDRFTFESYDEAIIKGTLVSVNKKQMIYRITYEDFLFGPTDYSDKEPKFETLDIVFIKPNYFGMIFDEYIYETETTRYDTIYFQRAFPIWREE